MAAPRNRCPHCKRSKCVAEIAFNNVETYGTNTFNMQCLYCKKMLRVGISRFVHLEFVEKSNLSSDAADF